MAISVPRNPKVYTTKYENFRGVDFTNDATNIWYRRSPTGTNMLPDSAGTPYKRNGWEILLSQDDICTELGVASCEITKCSYFELAGKDHIVIFTDNGVLFYNGEFTASSDKPECFESKDRCFFFEGDGMSAFYVYGNFKIWRYEYLPDDVNAVDGYVFHDVTDMCYIPTVVIESSANGAGTPYEAFNLLSDLAEIHYNDYHLLYYYGSDGVSFTFDESTWKANTTDYVECDPTTYWWKYDGASWNWAADYVPSRGEPPFPSAAVTVEDPHEDDEIVVLYGKGLMLPSNIDVSEQGDKVRVFVSEFAQFDKELEVKNDYSLLARGNCIVVQDELTRANPQSHIEFHKSDSWKGSTSFDGKDTFRVVFPIREMSSTQATESITDTATLVGEVV